MKLLGAFMEKLNPPAAVVVVAGGGAAAGCPKTGVPPLFAPVAANWKALPEPPLDAALPKLNPPPVVLFEVADIPDPNCGCVFATPNGLLVFDPNALEVALVDAPNEPKAGVAEAVVVVVADELAPNGLEVGCAPNAFVFDACPNDGAEVCPKPSVDGCALPNADDCVLAGWPNTLVWPFC